MGCDIHMYIEHKLNDPLARWGAFGGRINPGRHYGIFAKLVGVRNGLGLKPLSEPKGIPNDIAYRAESDYTLFISAESQNDGYCTPEKAAQWVRDKISMKWNEYRITHPDFHSASWATADELGKVFSDPAVQFDPELDIEYVAILDCLNSFERQGRLARVVFWFDN